MGMGMGMGVGMGMGPGQKILSWCHSCHPSTFVHSYAGILQDQSTSLRIARHKGYVRQGPRRHPTGIHRISSPYEVPEAPELTVETRTESLEDCVDQVVSYLESRGIIKPVNSL